PLVLEAIAEPVDDLAPGAEVESYGGFDRVTQSDGSLEAPSQPEQPLAPIVLFQKAQGAAEGQPRRVTPPDLALVVPVTLAPPGQARPPRGDGPRRDDARR